jgi:hypothetical protein
MDLCPSSVSATLRTAVIAVLWGLCSNGCSGEVGLAGAAGGGGRHNGTGAGGAGSQSTGGRAGSATTGGAGSGDDGGLDADTSTTDASGTISDGALDARRVDAGGVLRHPGILVNQDQLDFIKAKIAAGSEPWTSAFTKAQTSKWGALSYKPTPVAIVECGPYTNPDIGCSNERNDSVAAYTQALLWYFTGDVRYADKAIEIMNAWSAVLKDHTNHNAPLQSAWCSAMVPRAAEIIRWTTDRWAAADVDRFKALLKNVYLPKVVEGSGGNGNWELTMAEATMAIGVFLDDRSTFDKGVALWRGRVPAYVYSTSDGPAPKSPPGAPKSGAALVSFWYGQSMFVDGLAQETCRDLGHTQLGFAAMVNAAETARIQGLNLYHEEAARITAGYEFHAQYLNGAAVPSWLCSGKLNDVSDGGTWEIGYNEYVNRDGMSLPNTKQLILKNRPTGGGTQHIAWESLTHAEVGRVGIE